MPQPLDPEPPQIVSLNPTLIGASLEATARSRRDFLAQTIEVKNGRSERI